MLATAKNNKVTLAAVLIVISVVSATYLYFLKEERARQIQADGVSLARLLNTFSEAEDLNSIQRVFEHQLNFEHFAYGVVVDGAGQAMFTPVSREIGVPLPVLEIDFSAKGWMAQRPVAVGDLEIVEFYGPVRTHSSNPTFFRIGFHKAVIDLGSGAVSTLATLILPVFLLAPFLVFLQRRAVRPLSEINAKLADMSADQDLREVQISADSELKQLLGGFNQFVAQAQERIEAAETQSEKLVTEERFLTYRAERYESILQTVPDGIMILDEDFKVAFVNQHIEAMFDVDRNEVMSRAVGSWCQYQPMVEYVTNCQRDGQRLTGKVVHMPDPRASRRTLGLSNHPLYFSRSPTSNSGTLILLRDVSQEVAAKQSRAEFVGSVSHEIKAPLNTIGLYAQMLESNGDDSDFVIDAYNTITQEVERLTRLINSLLSMTQIEMGTFEMDMQRTYLPDVVRDCIDMLAHGEDASRIKVNCDQDISPVLVDKELMRIAISNLLTNALKYSDTACEVTVDVVETPDSITLSVTDKGHGIGEEDVERIFDKFYRSESEAAQVVRGHGLGLSIAKEILNLHHGSITVESELGKGSTFSLELWKRSGVARQAI